jgi:hypothetical protein
MTIILSDLQRSRLNYHLDLDSDQSLLAVSFSLRSAQFDQSKLLAIVGDLSIASPADTVYVGTVALCTTGSALGRCEVAKSNLGPSTIDNSLLVQSAGKVTLRRDELTARKQVYKEMVAQLKQEAGYTSLDAGRASLYL